jgi:hypothetical protein
MPIDDVDYLEKNSIKQSYSFLVDSKDRDRDSFPHPNNYTITFDNPFRNVVAFEVLEASIPRTMYNVDKYNNEFSFWINTGTDTEDLNQAGILHNRQNEINEIIQNKQKEADFINSVFQSILIEIGDYTIQTFIKKFNDQMANIGADLTLVSLSNPPEILNKVYFKSMHPFILNMNTSIRETLGFDEYQTTFNYSEADNILSLKRLFHSKFDEESQEFRIESPGIVNFIGEKYVIMQCPEIEENAFRSFSYSKYSLGLAKFRLGLVGYNDDRLDMTRTKLREFHPIGKLSKISIRFETSNGKLYDFKGVNHNIVFSVHYLEAKQLNTFETSILNPNYNANVLEYLYSEINLEDEDDEDDEYDEDMDRNRFEENQRLMQTLISEDD